MQAVAYMRLSADERQTGSISFAVQAQHIEALAANIGAFVVDAVQDNAISGAVPFKKRPGGKRVENLINTGKIEAILALRQERLFRDTKEALMYADAWERQGVKVYFAEDNGAPLDIKSPGGRLIYTVKAAAASYEREQTSLRVRENKASRKQQGKTYAPAMYGYDNVDGYTVANEKELAIIEQITKRRAAGHSLRQIAGWLNESGYPTKRGKSGWSAQIINDILKRHAQKPSPPKTDQA